MQCGYMSQHVQMLTLKTALIFSRSSSLQGSALGPLVHNGHLHIPCRDRCHPQVYAAVSTAAQSGMRGMTLSIQAAPGLLRSQCLFTSTTIVKNAILRETLCVCAVQSDCKRLARHYGVISCLICAVAIFKAVHCCIRHIACCAGNRLISRRRGTLAQKRPGLADQWDYESNGSVAPEVVQAGSGYVATWRCGKSCEECGKPHVWEARVAQRTSALGTNCPVCSGHKVCSCRSLATMRPDLMLEWADKNSLDPHTLGCFSAQKALWTCSKVPEHGSWSAKIANRAVARAAGCPKCANESRRGPLKARGLVKDEFPEVYAQLIPVPWSLDFLEGLTSGSRKKVWWRCTEIQNRPPNCSHEHVWQATVPSRCLLSRGCPFCSGRCVCPCDSIAGKASGMLDLWHFDKNTEVSPEQVRVHSHRKVWWRHICPTTGEEHEWQATVSHIYMAHLQDTSLRRGQHHIPCPVCWNGARKSSQQGPTGRPAGTCQQPE